MSHSSVALLSPPSTTDPSNQRKVLRSAQEFESELIGSLFGSLEKTFTALDGESHDSVMNAGGENYQYLGMKALADKLAAAGGLGIANMIARHLTKPATVERALSSRTQTKVFLRDADEQG